MPLEPSCTRTRPYSEAGILRVRCCRPGCENRAFYQWRTRACATGVEAEFYRPLCIPCDVELNRQTLVFFGEADVDSVIAAYAEEALAQWEAAGMDRRELAGAH